MALRIQDRRRRVRGVDQTGIDALGPQALEGVDEARQLALHVPVTRHVRGREVRERTGRDAAQAWPPDRARSVAASSARTPMRFMPVSTLRWKRATVPLAMAAAFRASSELLVNSVGTRPKLQKNGGRRGGRLGE